MLTLMHNVQTKSCSKDFIPLFEQNCSRYAKKKTYVLPSVKTEKGRTPVRYRGPIMWLQIPETLRKEQNKNTFKRKLKAMKDLILQATFNKESALITYKDNAFIYC